MQQDYGVLFHEDDTAISQGMEPDFRAWRIVIQDPSPKCGRLCPAASMPGRRLDRLKRCHAGSGFSEIPRRPPGRDLPQATPDLARTQDKRRQTWCPLVVALTKSQIAPDKARAYLHGGLDLFFGQSPEIATLDHLRLARRVQVHFHRNSIASSCVSRTGGTRQNAPHHLGGDGEERRTAQQSRSPREPTCRGHAA